MSPRYFVLGLVTVIACSPACSSSEPSGDDAAQTGGASGETGGEGGGGAGGGGADDDDATPIGEGGQPMAPDDCNPRISLRDDACIGPNQAPAELHCLSWEQLNDPCSAIQLRAITSNVGGADAHTAGPPPTSVDECPAYDEIIFGIQGACGALYFDDVCDEPVEFVGDKCCYMVVTSTNAC